MTDWAAVGTAAGAYKGRECVVRPGAAQTQEARVARQVLRVCVAAR